jgi:hypothetical protein
MPPEPRPDKQCAKCRRRQPLDRFVIGIAPEVLSARPRGSRFCFGCRTTTKRCRRCERVLPLAEFASSRGDRYGWCKGCYSEARRTLYSRAAERTAARERAKGRNPELSGGYQFYTQDPDEVLRRPGRRRAARLRAAERDGYRRADVFARDGWRCWLCGCVVDDETATIDHVVPIAAGGADTTDNVRTACHECNSRRGARDAKVFRALSPEAPRRRRCES